jgi:hypothetical protein
MPFAFRIRLDPVADGAPVAVTGVRFDFTTRGSGLTTAPKDVAVPATLEFKGNLTASVRDHPSPVECALGELTGTLTLSTNPKGITFTCDPDSLEKLTETPDDSDDSSDDDTPWTFAPSSLDVEFGDSFDGLDALDEDQVPKLVLPKNAIDYRYLEVFVKLTLQGAVEADFEQSDVLDVLIRLEPRPQFPFSL